MLPVSRLVTLSFKKIELDGLGVVMTFSFLGPAPLEEQLATVIERLAGGEPPERIEVASVDVKEEPGRRGRGGSVTPGTTQNEQAATYLAGELACMANSTGGGAIILGVADDGQRIGTEIEPQWLRHRIWALTEHKLTVLVREADLAGTRILVLTTHEAIEPIRYRGKIRWRVDDHCVEVDPTSWHAGRLQRTGADWSAQRSGHTISDASPGALEVARRYLRAAGDANDLDLAGATDEDLIRRLNLGDGNGYLTNAGSLLFIATPQAGIDYLRRDVPGGDSTGRVRSSGPLLTQVFEVERASEAANRQIHVPAGFAHGQVRAVPQRALREAVVNGVVHRDWLSPEPTIIEHIGDVVTVTSPGGFIGDIAPENIITHPAVARYRSLAGAMAALRLAERQGIGIDRMVRDMLALGHREPEITEIAGPWVRVGLIGGDPDPIVVDLLADIEPDTTNADLDALILLQILRRRGWVDVASAAPALQRPPAETEASLQRLTNTRIGRPYPATYSAKPYGRDPVVVGVNGVPSDQPPAYRLSDAVRDRLAPRLAHLTSPDGRMALILDWARARRRVSTTEVADLTGVTVPYAGQLLNRLATQGLLEGNRANKRGRGFHYTPVATGDG
jgi:ATP-dependent DNA helicase RecG